MRVQRNSMPAAFMLLALFGNCGGEPQVLPVVMTPDPVSQQLQWSDPGGPLQPEPPPWVFRSDLLGPETYLVVETEAGKSRCAREVRFPLVAGDSTGPVVEYTVTLESDLKGGIRWRITYGADKELTRIFTCQPRPTDNPKACLMGGIPKPLFGRLGGGISATLAGTPEELLAQSVRFERSPPLCR